MESYNSILRYFFPMLLFLQYFGCDSYERMPSSRGFESISKVVKTDCVEASKNVYNGFYAPAEEGKLFTFKGAYALDSITVAEQPIIGMADVKSVDKSYDSSGSPSILMTFTEKGKLIFKEYTSNNIRGKVVIIIKDKLITAPIINEEVPGGKVEISGNFTRKEADTIYMYVYKMIQCLNTTE